MVKEKTNLKGSKTLQKDFNNPEETSDLNDTQENLNDDLNDLGEDENVKNPKKDLNDLGEEEEDSENDQNGLEDDSEEDGLNDVMEKNGLGFQPKKPKSSARPVTSIHQQGQLPWIHVKGLQLDRDKEIMVGRRSFNYGAIEKVSPLEVRDQTLNVFNQNCTQFNNNVPRTHAPDAIPARKQETIVSKGTTNVDYFLTSKDASSIQIYLDKSKGLLSIDDPAQVRIILERTINKDFIKWLNQLLPDLPLQGNFWLTARPREFNEDENELYLDIYSLSMFRFHNLLELVRDSFKNKSDPQTTMELAKAKVKESIDKILILNLADMAEPGVFAQLATDLKDWYDPEVSITLSTLMSDKAQSKAVHAHAWDYLKQLKTVRAQQILSFLEAKGMGPNVSRQFVTYQEFVYNLTGTINDLTVYWRALAQWLEPERVFLNKIPTHKLHMVVQAVTRILDSSKEQKNSTSANQPRAHSMSSAAMFGKKASSTSSASVLGKRSSNDNSGSKPTQTAPQSEPMPSLAERKKDFLDCAKCGGKHKPKEGQAPDYCPLRMQTILMSILMPKRHGQIVHTISSIINTLGYYRPESLKGASNSAR